MLQVSEIKLEVINHNENNEGISVGADYAIKQLNNRVSQYNNIVKLLNKDFVTTNKKANKVDLLQIYLEEITPQPKKIFVIARDYDSIYINCSIIDNEGKFYGDVHCNTNDFDNDRYNKIVICVTKYLSDNYNLNDCQIYVR